MNHIAILEVISLVKVAIPQSAVPVEYLILYLYVIKVPSLYIRLVHLGMGLHNVGVTTMAEVNRYKCKLCGYIYSPLRGEPHNGIPAGTPFEDLPETYVCPICGMEGKGKIGKWGFDEWVPTKFVCSVCGYVYRPEPW